MNAGFRNPALFRSLRSYTELLSRRIEEHLKQPGGQVVIDKPKWVRHQGDTFAQATESERYLIFVHGELREDLQSSGEYRDVLAVLQADAALSRQLDCLVGSEFGASRAEAFHLINSIGLDIYRTLGRTYNEDLFRELYLPYEGRLYAETVLYERLIPLLGLGLSEDIDIAPGLALICLTDDHVSDLLTHGLTLGRTFPLLGSVALANEIHRGAIRVQVVVPRKFGNASFVPNMLPTDESKRFREESDEQALLRALHVYRAGRLHVAGNVTRGTGFPSTGVGFRVTPPEVMPSRGNYQLSKADVEPLRSLFTMLQSAHVGNTRFLDVAIRRFMYAAERKREEDRLIDYMIAAEAMFLNDSEHQGELRFRLSSRIARFLEQRVTQRKTVARLVRNAYDIRSKVVHGLEPQVGREVIDLAAFNTSLDNLLRTALAEFIRRAATNSGMPDWDEVMLS